MENLLVLLDKIQHVYPLPIFSKDVVIVQNAGMQHWLNMSLAKRRGISMNIDYALPSQFLWKLVRSIVSEEDVPDQSPFSREVLAWRIYELLAQDNVMNDVDFETATRYWMGKQTPTNDEVLIKNSSVDFTVDNELKRYQLACQMADLFEQYLIFRPNWINDWENGRFSAGITDEDAKDVAQWQGKLWYLLTREQSYNPITLIEKAVEQLQSNTSQLPERISFFGINIMAPMWLSFINELSEYVDVHFFHLNPCYAYWGDIVTEKQAIKSIQQWVDGHDDITQTVGNPLLANLGQQGREFMALLHTFSTINIDVFEDVIADNEHSSTQPTVLQQVQHDILALEDARTEPKQHTDNSIVITSCHSALREVQGLHDWLLHQFNANDGLTPKDVLVMCPQVEDYAPYVNAVFARGWQDFDDKIPPLPCSIADRISKDSEPVVVAFSDLLTLPDSRFQVSQLVSFLRIPAMQTKFGLTIEDIDKITAWLDLASIHWGLDQSHKGDVLNSKAVTSNFTWQQGLSRLVRGFAFGDTETIVDNQLLLPTIEGHDGELLGQLMLILEQLQLFATQLSQARSAVQWQSFLNRLIDDLFDRTTDEGFSIIDNAIESLIEYCLHAKFEENINLHIVRDFLNQHFSQPEPGRQFMVGQVTFCSMLPMRSIPFKVIAILGLNDGLFPRQRQPLSFDLMASTPMKLGDRSRRGDDRYLFLEAIISARQALYLSYQGKNIRNNAPKQASLVLKELMEYLELGYGWKLLNESTSVEQGSNLRSLPMQAFSEKNYHGYFKSFDNHWFKLSQALEVTNNIPSLIQLSSESVFSEMFDYPFSDVSSNVTDELPHISLNMSQLISFFQHPSKTFARQQLGLNFDSYALELDDSEPFDFDRLETYLLRQQLLQDCLNESNENTNIEERIQHTLTRAKLSGKFPETITRDKVFENYKQDTLAFNEAINTHECLVTRNENIAICLDVELIVNSVNTKVRVQLDAQLPIANDKLVFYRSSSAKSKDFIGLYLHQLVLQVHQEQYLSQTNNVDFDTNNTSQNLTHIGATHGLYFDTKSQKIMQYRYRNLSAPLEQLSRFITQYFNGNLTPLLFNGEIVEKAFKAKVFEQKEFEHFWSDSNAFMPLGSDPYIHYFWSECPDYNTLKPQLESLYLEMFTSREQIK
jgi:exodeoxyribonuclease V gamma subunit